MTSNEPQSHHLMSYFPLTSFLKQAGQTAHCLAVGGEQLSLALAQMVGLDAWKMVNKLLLVMGAAQL